jgi:hypothetical protein
VLAEVTKTGVDGKTWNNRDGNWNGRPRYIVKGAFMTRHLKVRWLWVCMAVLALAMFAAEKKQSTPPAPIPAQILAAKRVLVTNGGGDDYALFTGGSTRAYDELYAALKTAARYDLVASPADADLIFQIQFSVGVPPGVTRSTLGIGSVPYSSELRLEIRDPKTNVLLWAFIDHPDGAMLQGNRDKNLDEAMARIVAGLQALSAAPGPQ